MSYKGQVLRGEKWFHLMTEEQLAKEPAESSKPGDVEAYLKLREEEAKKKGGKK